TSSTLTGSTGSDTFVFTSTQVGTDIITDFEAGARSDDIIFFDKDVFVDFDAVLAATSDDENSTVIKLGDENSITLNSVLKADLHADDFQFI
ncbi:hypothetical protein SAMN05421798_1662, partial [Pseudovibrio axinellae]